MSRRAAIPTETFSPRGPLLLQLLAALLLGLRLLLPTEGAVLGETLLITQGWFALAAVWAAWRLWRGGEAIRWSWADVAVAGLVLAHWISGLPVVWQGGDRRAALNLLWEWVGLGATYFLLRQWITTWQTMRPLLLGLVLTVAALAGLGLSQHYYWYDATAREYDALRSELDQLEQAALTPAKLSRKQEIEAEFRLQGVPLTGHARYMWEQRLRNSREPFGPFALANTFAGLLLVGLFPALSLLLTGWKTGGTRRRLLPGLLVGVMFLCLILTKSRTAYVSLFAGGLVWLTHRLRWRERLPAVWKLAAGAGAVLLTVIAVGLTGGLDWKVLSETPKSLTYRMEYWRGSWQILRERPLGVGPGNFRPYYLVEKVPEASEEIADPHNFLLDLWASGGLLAVACALALIGMTAWKFLRLAPLETTNAEPEPSPWRLPLALGFGLSFLSLWGVTWLLGSAAHQWLILGGVWFALAWLWERYGSGEMTVASLAAAGGALLVHLLGAGGIEMPAIPQLLLLIVVAVQLVPEPESPQPSRTVASWALLAVGLACFFGCWNWATRPVFERELKIAAGDYELFRQHNPRGARKQYELAALADPWSTEPPGRLAELSFQLWQESGTEDDFNRTLDRLAAIRVVNPLLLSPWERQGELYLQRFERTEDPADARLAADAFLTALSMYPSSALLCARTAIAWSQTDTPEAAVEFARRALELQEINYRRGHLDRLLPEEMLEKLRELAR